MADNASFQERTEAPTPRRRQQAREEGQVPRSPEVTTAIMLLAAAGLVAVAGERLGGMLGRTFQQMALVGAAPPASPAEVTALIRQLGGQVAAAVVPLLLGMMATAGLVAGAQARGTLTAKPLKPKWERLAPHENIKRMVGVRSVAELVKSLLKLGLMAAVLYPVLWTALKASGELALRPPMGLAAELRGSAAKLLGLAGAAYLVVALADYAYQVWQHERQLKMSKEDIKREAKEQEGDAMLKARRRSMGRDRARQRMFREVATADVVVTNPTHIAVALRYQPDVIAAPVIVAMGERKVAQRIKRLAYDAGVPVMENKPLARALFAAGRVGEAIPSDLYVAVAEVLAFVIKQREAEAAWKLSGAPLPGDAVDEVVS